MFLSEGSDWDFELLARYDEAIADLAHNKYGLDTYPCLLYTSPSPRDRG